jgi:hypothetical protein
MYIRTVSGRVPICVLLMFGSVTARACELPAGTALWLRLSTPVSSYFSKAGSEIHAILTEDLVCDAAVALPAGTPIEGRVHSVKKVGWGFRHEIASLELEFNRLHLADGSSLDIESRVLEVENSRESVKNGVIIGIRSTDTPQGTINSRLKHLPTWNPYTDAVLIAYKATFPIFPEPEIWYGPGTDLRLQLVDPLQVQPAPLSQPTAAPALEDHEQKSIVAQFPERVLTLDKKDADVVNLAFLASREQLQAAFLAAGWVSSDNFSTVSFLHEFHAFLNHSGYATAPMRPMLLRNAMPDMLWQKSLNTYSKRDHLRIWKSPNTLDGTTVWIGASTHDDGATLSLRNKRFVHNINPQIDNERAKIVRDLRMAGCVQSVSLVERPELPHSLLNATGDPVRTDSKVALIQLKDCSGSEFRQSKATTFQPGNVAFRYLRRQILTLRSDIWRANIIYGAYDLIRLLGRTAHSLERPPSLPEDAVTSHEMTSHPAATGPIPESSHRGNGFADTYTPCL